MQLCNQVHQKQNDALYYLIMVADGAYIPLNWAHEPLNGLELFSPCYPWFFLFCDNIQCPERKILHANRDTWKMEVLGSTFNFLSFPFFMHCIPMNMVHKKLIKMAFHVNGFKTSFFKWKPYICRSVQKKKIGVYILYQTLLSTQAFRLYVDLT